MADTQRLDKCLWRARFFKSRSAAARFCDEGKLRVSGQVTHKAHYGLRPGDVLTFPLGPHIRVIKVMVLAGRRGPPVEARSLYEDLAPPVPRVPAEQSEGESGHREPG